jgi:hypothetical protein
VNKSGGPEVCFTNCGAYTLKKYESEYCTTLSKASLLLFIHTLAESAQMAELVDALVSGTSIRKYVQVRVLFWAQGSKSKSKEQE